MPRAFRVPARVYVRLALYLGLCWGMVGVLVHGVVAHSAWLVAALALYTTFPLLLFLNFGGFPFYPGRAFRLLVVRPFWYAQPLLFLATVFGVLGFMAGWPFGHALDVARLAAGTIVAVMTLLYTAGYVGAARLVVHELEAALPTLSPDLDGLTIAQISDLHVGPHTSRRFLRRVDAAVRAVAADIVVVTGDLVDDRHEDVAAYAAVFGSLRAPFGVFVVPGNHDIYAGWDAVRRGLDESAVGRVLVNESVVVRRGGGALVLAGTGDPAGGPIGGRDPAPDIRRMLSSVAPEVTVVALAHNPALWPALVERGVALTLSGHTHWGQIALPRFAWSLASPFLELAMGAYQRGDSLLYIAPGTGYWGIPFRIGAPSEVTLVRLRRGPAAIRDLGRRRPVNSRS